MKTIKVLTRDYQNRFNIWINQAVKGGVKRGRKARVIKDVPNYLIEVIIPIITGLAERMPDHLIELPNPEKYGIEKGDIYPIIIGNKTIGGLTYLEYKESEIYFVPMNGRHITDDKIPAVSFKRLEFIIRSHLAKLNGRTPLKESYNIDDE